VDKSKDHERNGNEADDNDGKIGTHLPTTFAQDTVPVACILGGNRENPTEITDERTPSEMILIVRDSCGMLTRLPKESSDRLRSPDQSKSLRVRRNSRASVPLEYRAIRPSASGNWIPMLFALDRTFNEAGNRERIAFSRPRLKDYLE